MTGSAYLEDIREDYMVNPTVFDNRFVMSGSYALRRANYISKIKQELPLSAEQTYAFKTLFLTGTQ